MNGNNKAEVKAKAVGKAKKPEQRVANRIDRFFTKNEIKKREEPIGAQQNRFTRGERAG